MDYEKSYVKGIVMVAVFRLLRHWIVLEEVAMELSKYKQVCFCLFILVFTL